EHLTAGEAAAYLGVAKITLRQWDRAGKLKARRHPMTGYRLYPKGDLAALLRQVTGKDSRRGRSRKAKQQGR
ncbi:MAG: MerR family DNA-binding transcriptional regulator, partial [Dehalococcoidia bacterium]